MLSSNCKKKYYKVVIDGAKLLGEPAKHDERTHDNIQKIKNGHGDNYTTACLLDDTYLTKKL